MADNLLPDPENPVKHDVRITDVSPRDGLQNEARPIPTAEKVRLVQLLCATGVDEVEVSSFVSPKWVPQLGDAKEVFAALGKWLAEGRGGAVRPAHAATMFSALVPNAKGMEAAEEVARTRGLLGKVSVFTAASETFNRKNTNAGIAESIERFREVVERAKHGGPEPLLVRGYISCAVACPFEGAISPGKVADVAAMLARVGVDEIDLGDTIGAGTPQTVGAMLEAVRRTLGAEWWTAERMTLHLHDTFGRAGECVKAALDAGVRSFDGSAGGLGGCPYASTTNPDGTAKRAPGNISTDLLVRTVHAAGFTTGVNLDRLAEASAQARLMVAGA